MTIAEAIKQALRELGATEEQVEAGIQNAYRMSPELRITGKTNIPPGTERERVEELKAFYQMPESFQDNHLRMAEQDFLNRISAN